MIDAHEVPQSSPTTDTSMGALSPRAPHPKGFNHPVGSPPEPRTRRICGLRRGLFWLMFGVVLALVIVAAVVGGVVGGSRHSSKPSVAPGSNPPAVPANPNMPVEYVSYDPYQEPSRLTILPQTRRCNRGLAIKRSLIQWVKQSTNLPRLLPISPGQHKGSRIG